MAHAGGERLSGWRRLAFATWQAPPADPSMRGHLILDAGPALAYIEQARVADGRRITLTHLAVKAVACALAANPALNVRRQGHRLVPRGRVDVGLVVAFDEGRQQAVVTVEDAAQKSVADIAVEIEERAGRLRRSGTHELAGAGRVIDRLPVPVLRAGLRFLSWLSTERNVDLTRFGFPEYGLRRGGFGSALVTSVGMLGLDHGFPLLSPHTRVPIAMLVGRISERALVVDGEVQARPAFELSFTIDHRYVDGWQLGRLAAVLRDYFAGPAAFGPAAS